MLVEGVWAWEREGELLENALGGQSDAFPAVGELSMFFHILTAG
jgi:hypothetical protein